MRNDIDDENFDSITNTPHHHYSVDKDLIRQHYNVTDLS